MSVVDNALQTLLGLSNKVDLLWENASPSSDFAAQNLNITTDGYDQIAIVSEYDYIFVFNLPARNTAMIEIVGMANSSAHIYRRSVVAHDGQIKFCDTIDIVELGITNTGTRNGLCTPIRIYGIKSLGGGA